MQTLQLNELLGLGAVRLGLCILYVILGLAVRLFGHPARKKTMIFWRSADYIVSTTANCQLLSVSTPTVTPVELVEYY